MLFFGSTQTSGINGKHLNQFIIQFEKPKMKILKFNF